MSTERWIDVTTVGSSYEQQVSESGAWRHRRLRIRAVFDRDRAGTLEDLVERGFGEWEPGPAPDIN